MTISGPYNRIAQVVFFIVASCVLAAPLNASEIVWREIVGKQFVLRGQRSEDNLSAIACDFERVARTLHQAYGNDSSVPRASVIVVNSERELRGLLPQFWEHRGAKPLGAYWSGPFGPHIAIRVDVSPRERLRRILHEYAHFVTHSSYGDAAPWLDEGLSELWTNAEIDGDDVEIGRPISAHLRLLKASADWIPVQELVAAKALPPSSNRERLSRFYAESWALVHYLAFERGGGRLTLIPQLGSDNLPQDAELQRYVKKWQPRAKPIRVLAAVGAEAPCSAHEVHEIEPLDALIGQAQALTDGERPAAALPLLHQAALLTPSSPQIAEITAVVRFLGSDTTQAAALFDQLIAAGTASHLSYYYRALLAEVVPSRSDGAGPVPMAEYLKTAIRLNPSFAPARERLTTLGEHP